MGVTIEEGVLNSQSDLTLWQLWTHKLYSLSQARVERSVAATLLESGESFRFFFFFYKRIVTWSYGH